MANYIAKRIALMFVTLLGISLIVFVLLRIVPGNITDIIFDSAGFIRDSERAVIEQSLGLDKPILHQYLTWLSGILRGDFGYSFMTEQPAMEEFISRLPVSARLGFMTLIVTLGLGIPLGVICAVKQNTYIDNALRVIALGCLSVPSFWFGLIVLMLAVHYFGQLPIYQTGLGVVQEFPLLILPALVGGVRGSAAVMRLMRASMLEVLRQDYIRTARSKGVPPAIIYFSHAFRNALLPMINIIGREFVDVVSGSIIIETVFNIPGIGVYLVEAIKWRDYPVVMNIVMFKATLVVVSNLVEDLIYASVDPRIRYN